MLITAFPCGNHSNRLFQNLHFEAFCMEYGIEYINPSFYDMHKYYIAPCDLNKGSKGNFYKMYELKLIIKLLIKIVRRLEIGKYIKCIEMFNSTNENNANILLSLLTLLPSHDIYVGGWYFRVNDLAEKYQDYFIEKYTLKDKYIKNNTLMNLINDMREKGTLVVGVHIRRGDYRYWGNGKYYFDDNVYKNYMHTLAGEIKRNYNQHVCFMIFSNEDISINENKYIYISNNE